MEIKKFRHACLQLTKDNVSLVIDPGGWSTDFEPNNHTIGIIITHEHFDHLDVQRIKQVIGRNPKLSVFAHVDVIAQLDGIESVVKLPVHPNHQLSHGPFLLRFTGGDHARMFPDTPICANLGVVVNEGELYYPGDSFALPDCTVETLPFPTSAPWRKTAEAMNFIQAVKPKTCFPTHNALLSPEGQQLADAWLAKAASSVGTEYKIL